MQSLWQTSGKSFNNVIYIFIHVASFKVTQVHESRMIAGTSVNYTHNYIVGDYLLRASTDRLSDFNCLPRILINSFSLNRILFNYKVALHKPPRCNAVERFKRVSGVSRVSP
ncbi:hypothetical protein PUN28_001538 [Cardiocondyla obscurior]|uniref:Uncharacterized protein n=1 Tax=Cardiocondyla obscurior TaxID=286306 RepID=A0AAW2H5F6_9HYME